MNTWAWLAWLAAALAWLSATRNPLYLLLAWMSLNMVYLGVAQRAQGAAPSAPVSPLKLSLFMVGMAALFNATTSHFGQTTLFTIPGRLPLLSGPVTLEALVYGATNGLVLSGMLIAFATLNLALPVHALLHLAPRAFYPLAIVASIALTFLPSMRRQFDEAVEAQVIRGRRPSGVRDWLLLVMPLLVGGLERSLQLAETMTARGFASQVDPAAMGRSRAVLLAGSLLLLGGWLGEPLGWPLAGRGALLAGVGLIVGALWYIGRQARRTRFQRQGWRAVDFLVAGGSLLVAGLLLAKFPAVVFAPLDYQPYPLVGLPAFDPWSGMLSLALLLPAVTWSRQP